jgi:hypothetical protein
MPNCLQYTHMIQYTQGILKVMEHQFWLYHNAAQHEPIVIDESQGSQDSEREVSDDGKSNDGQ